MGGAGGGVEMLLVVCATETGISSGYLARVQVLFLQKLARICILLDVLMCSIAEYFYELCRILTSPWGESKYKQRLKLLRDTTQQNA